MSAQTPIIDTTPSPACAPPGPVDPSADEVVDRFLSDLRRRDLDALALLLRGDPAGDAAGSGAAGSGAPSRHAASADEAARDCAQVVLRSFSGSGLVETERHASTDGRTVFVEFRRDHPDAGGWTERRTGARLLRFTTSSGSITGITEYAHPSGGESRRGDLRGAMMPPGGDESGAGRGGRVSDSLAWPSLDAVRPPGRHTAGR